MANYQFLVIHCADTYPSFVLTKEILDEWHKGPRDEKGQVVYLGKYYPNRESLPDDYINGKSVKTLYGRGWDRDGYSELIHRDGSVEVITPHNDDDIITNEEMTWGATGFNGNGRHVCLEGGRPPKPMTPQPPMKGAEEILYTPQQLEALTNYVLIETANHPQIKVAGHYMLTNMKNCPNFDVREWLKEIGREEFCYKP
jgi:N-acetylmuramoyl-L-alanine amidase